MLDLSLPSQSAFVQEAVGVPTVFAESELSDLREETMPPADYRRCLCGWLGADAKPFRSVVALAARMGRQVVVSSVPHAGLFRQIVGVRMANRS